MADRLWRLSSQAAVYGLGYGLTRFLQFALLPLYTRYLAPSDFGILALLLITGSIMTVLSQVGLGSAMFREIIYLDTDRRIVESTAILFLVAVASVLYTVAHVLSSDLSVALFATDQYSRLLRLVFLTSALGIFEAILLARFRVQQRPKLYTVLALLRFLMGAAFTVYFIVILKRGLDGLVEATLVTAALFALVYAAILYRDLSLVFSIPVLRRFLRFGTPLVPASLSGLSMSSADRYILQHFTTTAQVGVYSLGYNISLIMNLAINAIQLAWPAQMFTIAKEPDAERQLARLLNYYLFGIGWLALAISVFARELVRVMATPAFFGASQVVPWICLAYLLYGMALMINTGLNVKDQMKYSGMVSTAAALANIALCFWLIPGHGILGAAWSTAISYAIFLVGLTVANLRFWRIPYEYGRLAGIAIVGLAVYGVSLFIPELNIWWSGTLKCGLLVTYPILLRAAKLI